ncbi:MAG: hypothetical protein ACOC42_01550 [Halobacteriota archaeon]
MTQSHSPLRAYLYPLAVWVLMAAIAIVNGGFRELVLVPAIGAYPGHVLSTAMLVAAILIVAYLFFRRSTISYTRAELGAIGVAWVLLTIAFEFAVGSLEGATVAETAGQYDVLAGRVWILVPVTLLVAPLLLGWYLERR